MSYHLHIPFPEELGEKEFYRCWARVEWLRKVEIPRVQRMVFSEP